MNNELVPVTSASVMNSELVLVTSGSVMNNELVLVTSASVMNDHKFVHATSAGVCGRGRDVQMSPSLSGIWGEAVQLNQVQGHLKSMLNAAEGKEIQNKELVQYLREARDEDSQTDDLLSELAYYRIKEELEHEVIASCHDFFPLYM
jgi:hypothetical protein